MFRQHQYVNISTDILRTVVTIVDLGSFGKAGERLGLSQPAISAQIKRMQVMVGGPIFSRSAGGVVLNERGKLMAPIIRNILAANDQLLQIGGAVKASRNIRIGLTYMYGSRFILDNRLEDMRKFSIVCDHSQDLLRHLADGYIDVCAVFEPAAYAGHIVEQWKEKVVWVRSPGFTLSSGEPVPLVGWPGMIGDQIATKILEKNGISYRFACTSNEAACRVDAVAAGLGVMILPAWTVPDGLVEAQEYYLPPIPLVDAGIMRGRNADMSLLKPVLKMMSTLGDHRFNDTSEVEESKKTR